VTGGTSISLDIMTKARDELAEAESNIEEDTYRTEAFPHVRLSPERARYYSERLKALVEDILYEKPDPDGKVYGVLVSMFMAPAYLQGPSTSTPTDSAVAGERES